MVDSCQVIITICNQRRLTAMIGDDSADEIDTFTVEKLGPFTLYLQVAEDDFNNGKKTLFATMIWHGSRALAEHLISNFSDSVQSKSVIEFGAGAGLPSLICHKLGAALVTSSDYPARSVTRNLISNAARNILCDHTLGLQTSCLSSDNEDDRAVQDNLQLSEKKFYVIEHIWGETASPLLDPLYGVSDKYDVVIASECLWKSDTHEDFAHSINNVLKPGGVCLMSFSHHIPGLESKDLAFFKIMERNNFSVINVHEVAVPHMWSDKCAVVYIYELLKGV